MKNITLKAIDNYELSLAIYEAKNAKGYVQIIHGMQEHKERYNYFANKLLEAGYTVVVSDTRGHGYNAPILGYTAEKNGDKLILEDQKLITEYIKNTYQIDKVILFGHSMGSIVARNLLQSETENYSCTILSGYPNYQSAVKLGLLIAKAIRKIKGGKHYSKLLTSLSVGSFNKKIKNPKTKVDWLSVNEDNVEEYINDPYSGHKFLTSSFVDLFQLMVNMNKVSNYKNVKSIPLLLLRGMEDPCTGGNKGSFNSIKTMSKAGLRNITELKYENMRHEILNEKNKDLVINDILEFLIMIQQ